MSRLHAQLSQHEQVALRRVAQAGTAGLASAYIERLRQLRLIEANGTSWRLTALGRLKPWPKVTGGKGIHIMASLPERLTHDRAHAYARQLAERLAATEPERYTVSASMAARPGRLFIDYLRNGRGTTAVGAYSP